MATVEDVIEALKTVALEGRRSDSKHVPEVLVTNAHGHGYAIRLMKDGSFIVAHKGSKPGPIETCSTMREVLAEVQRETPPRPAIPPGMN